MSASAKGNSASEKHISLEQLVDYLEGNLSPREQRKIAAAIREHELYREGTEGLSIVKDREKLKDTVEQLNRQIEAASSRLPKERKIRKMVYSAAAIFILLLLPTIYLLLPGTPENTFQQFYEPYPNIIPLVRGDSTRNALESAMIRYEQNDFQEALAILTAIPPDSPDYITARFYSGISHLSLGQVESAKAALKEVLTSGDSRLSAAAGWYLALAHLKVNEKAQARTLLMDLRLHDSLFKKPAEELLRVLAEE